MAEIAENGQKRLIFIVVLLLRIKDIKKRLKKSRKIYLKYKKYM